MQNYWQKAVQYTSELAADGVSDGFCLNNNFQGGGYQNSSGGYGGTEGNGGYNGNGSYNSEPRETDSYKPPNQRTMQVDRQPEPDLEDWLNDEEKPKSKKKERPSRRKEKEETEERAAPQEEEEPKPEASGWDDWGEAIETKPKATARKPPSKSSPPVSDSPAKKPAKKGDDDWDEWDNQEEAPKVHAKKEQSADGWDNWDM
jgi:hypothetical protein